MATGILVNEAFQQLCDWIDQARLKPGARLPSERALARATGLGHYAVNRAMSRCIAEGRVERQGYKLFLADRPAARAGSRLTVALVIARRSEHLAGFRRVARLLDINLVVRTWEAAEEVAPILLRLEGESVDGVVCDPPTQNVWVQAALRLDRRGPPVVCMSWTSDAISSVTSHTTHGLQLAVTHLAELGHREIGLVNPPHATPRGFDIANTWQGFCDRFRLGSSGERIRHEAGWVATQDEVEQLADLLVGPWREVTGLVIRVGHSCALPGLLTELARRGRRAPESLSLVAVGNARGLLAAQPRVTSVSVDMALWHEMAFDLLLREVRKRRHLGVSPAPSIVQVVPRLQLRESTSHRGEPPQPAPTRLANDEPRAFRRHGLAAEELDKKLRAPYSLAAKASLSARPRFAPIDLAPHVNRPLNFRRGWLGDLPLRCLPPGPREIHGVPFNILGGPARSDLGVVVFHSAVNSTGNSRSLPDRVKIPLGLRAEAVYILHGCGFAQTRQPFARYVFHRARGRPDTVPLVSLGKASEDAPGDANIQDWWSDFPHLDFPHARMVPLLEHDEGGLVGRHVFLYTLEWINPSPDRPLSHLEIVADPSVATTLGLLAVTVVKPRGA